MPLKTDFVEEPVLNLTPMIDIVFLLIIFFMVGSEFTKKRADAEGHFKIQLPTVADVRPLTDLPDPIIIDVPISGSMLVQGGPQNARATSCTKKELEQFLVEAKRIDTQRKFDKRAVILRGDGEGKYSRVTDVMELCKKAQFRSVSLALMPRKQATSKQPGAESKTGGEK
jgi:biopolymer transport protein ExbD